MNDAPNISTHTPHARCDFTSSAKVNCQRDFYSHTSCEVRLFCVNVLCRFKHFYSHTSCEVRRCKIRQIKTKQYFYSHTSCEVRPHTQDLLRQSMQFLLTHLMRGATEGRLKKTALSIISTHTPHARCDVPIQVERVKTVLFLLTHLMRGATSVTDKNAMSEIISTHTPHARCD